MSDNGFTVPLRWGEPLRSLDDGFVLPAGTVTLLLADADGAPWTDVLDDAAGDAVGRCGGVRPLGDHDDDSFVAAFDRASEAVAAALHMQRSGDSLRIAIHTGEVASTDGRRHVAVPLRRAARLRDVSHGGQILVSQSAAQLVVDHLPRDAVLTDLGLHRLHDLLRPERVWQLCHPDLPSSFPPLRSLDAQVSLPVQRTDFIGREHEIEEVVSLLATSSLLTLTGAGGCGKTRLAVQVASELASSFSDGVVFVDLAPVESPDLVGAAAAAALGVAEDPSRRAIDVIASALTHRSVLVVLDNCEHVVDGVARLADALLRVARAVSVLATSREPLAVDGEITWRVPSMTFPSVDAPVAIDGLPRYEAVALFCDRAARSRPGFVLDETNAAAITDICRRLDGIPLAIELAAARTRVLTPDQIARGLEDRFRLLVGGARTAVPRQQTLRASVDWSYALLTEPERVVLRRVAVFAGGFTVDAAEAVCAGGDVESHQVLDLVSLLIDKSLVLADEDVDGRFRLLETVRQYALEQLQVAGEDTATRDRHLGHVAAFAAAAAPNLLGPEAVAWHDRLHRERGNLDAALAWGGSGGDADVACQLAADLLYHWYARFQSSSAATALPALLDRTVGAASFGRARVLATHAFLVGLATGDLTVTRASAEEAIDLARSLGDDWSFVRAIHALAQGLLLGTPPEGIGLASEGVEVAARAGDFWAELDCTEVVAMAEFLLGHLPAAGQHFQRVIDLARPRGFDLGLAEGLMMLSCVRAAAGDLDGAQSLLDEGEQLAVHLGHDLWRGVAVAWNGGLLRRRGALDQAWARCRDGSARAHEVNAMYASMADLELAATAIDRGDASFAADLAGGSARSWHDLGITAFEVQWLPVLGEARLQLGDANGAEVAFQRAIDATKSWDDRNVSAQARLGLARLALADQQLERAESLAHDAMEALISVGASPSIADALDVLAALAVAFGRDRDATRAAAASDAWRRASGYVRPRQHMSWLTAAMDVAAARLGEDDLAVARADGAAMSLDEATAYLRRGRGKRGRPAGGWASLTPTENQVVDLVARGLSNPEVAARLFMSRRTVQTHLTHVYAKLGLTSRMELAAARAERADRP